MTTEELNKNEKDSLFRNLYKSLHCLSEVLHNRGFRSFYETVKRIVYEIGVCQSNINLFEKESLEQAIGIITSIEQRLSNRIQDERHHASPHAIPRKLEETSDTILDAIKNLLNSFEYYKSKINSTKRPRKSRWSPPDVPSTNTQEYTESKPAIHSNQHQSRNNENDDYDDQSSEASRSSFGDEVLMEVARDAYEQRPNHHK
ncbi:hypothetical protein I4U23_012068 [Adineta vaga]|nr:hypothetical protein I4U23_012068 [Adineta vaga]